MKLYYAPGTCAVACWMSMEWAGAEYDVERVDFKSAEYKKVNPLGLVPALEIGASRAMTQVGAILQYIVNKYPESDLGANSGLENEFEFNETLAFLGGDFHPAFWPVFAPFRFVKNAGDKELDSVRNAAYERVDRVMTHLDNLIGNTNHVYQDKKTVLDAYAFVMAKWSEYTPKSWKEYSNIARFMENMEKDEQVQKVLDLSKKL